MTPDLKYMPRVIDESDSNNDLKFSKFNIQPPFNNSMIGCVPIMMLDNPIGKNIGNNFSPFLHSTPPSMQGLSPIGFNNLNPNLNQNQVPNWNMMNPNWSMDNQNPNMMNPSWSMDNQSPNMMNPNWNMSNQSPNMMNPNWNMSNQSSNMMNPNWSMDNQSPNMMNPNWSMDNQSPNMMNPNWSMDNQSPNMMNPNWSLDNQGSNMMNPNWNMDNQSPNMMNPNWSLDNQGSNMMNPNWSLDKQSPNMINPNQNINTDSSLQYPAESDDQLYSYNTPTTSKQNPSTNTNNTSTNTTSINQNYMNNSSMSTTQNNLARIPTPSDVLRILDLNLDEEIDLDRHKQGKEKNIDMIYKHIKDECPGIINALCEYNIPEPIYKLLIKKVIKLSLHHCKRE